MYFQAAAFAYALSLLPSLAVADYSKAKKCTDYTIPVTTTTTNLVWAKPFANNYDVVDFVTNIASRTASTDFLPYIFNGSYVATANYSISATFCTPTGKNNGIALLATHGLNFDRSYWDPDIEDGTYSFVNWAIGLGYSVFFYDRLGVGKSTLLSGYVNQISIQAAILEQLSAFVKAGKYTGSFGVPKKFVLVGHSFGSELSATVTAANNDIADGLILTGFNYNGTNGAGFFEVFAPRIASTVHSQWVDFDSAYITAVDLYSDINAFLKAPDYEVSVAEYTHRNRQPLSVNEVLSGAISDTTPYNYTGVAMVIAGQYDLIFCTSQCDDVIAHPSTEIFSKAKAFKAVSFPGAGHGLNFVTNHTGAFQEITDFMGANGL